MRSIQQGESEVVTFWLGNRRITALVRRSTKDESGARSVTVDVDGAEVTMPATYVAFERQAS